MNKKYKFGEIWLADLSPRLGTELGKVRPVLIIQNQILLDAEHPSTLIVPLSTNLIEGAYPLRIRIKAFEKLERDSDLLIDQIRAIDNIRLGTGPILKCDSTTMEQVLAAVSEVISSN